MSDLELNNSRNFEIELNPKHVLFYNRQNYFITANNRIYAVEKKDGNIMVKFSHTQNSQTRWIVGKHTAASKLNSNNFLNFSFHLDKKQIQYSLLFFSLLNLFLLCSIAPVAIKDIPQGFLFFNLFFIGFLILRMKFGRKVWIKRFKEDLPHMELIYQ